MTIGFSLLSFDGKLVLVGTRKNFGLSSIIKLLSRYGKIKVVSSDRADAPAFIKKLATKVDAKIISPLEDFTFKKKKQILQSYDEELYQHIKNKHELSAVSAAIFAYRRLKELDKKI